MPGFDDLCPRTTRARKFVAPDSLNYFDLEEPRSLLRLTELDTALRPLEKDASFAA
jgi:hypothetical protein